MSVMRISRITGLALSGAVVLGLVPVALSATTASAATQPTAPKGLTVQRDAGSVDDLLISWKAVEGVDHYMVRVNNGATDTNYIVPASQTSYVHHGSGACVHYRVLVSAVTADGSMSDTAAWTVPSLAPTGASRLAGLRNESGTASSVTWAAPNNPGYGGKLDYRVQIVQMSTGKAVISRESSSAVESLSGLDPTSMYAARVTATNAYGSCATSTMAIGSNRPSSPAFQIRRATDDASKEAVAWSAPTWQGYGPVTSYLIGYKSVVQKDYTWVKASAGQRSVVIAKLDPNVNWTFVMRAMSSNDVGLLSHTAVQMKSGYQPRAATVKVTGGDSSITVDFSAPVGASSTFPTARIDVARANGTGGWSDSHSVTNGAGQSVFLPVPCGVWAVTVTGQGKAASQEATRSTVRVCSAAPACFVSTLQNGGFEAPAIAAKSYKFVAAGTSGLAWNNLAEPVVELWSTGFTGVTAPEGSQFAEINANKAGTLYQDLATTPGTTMRWHFEHRGRSGVDTMRVMIGAPQGTLHQSGANISTGNTAWQQYTGTYTVPAGQTTTRFAFQAVSAGSYGNFIDNIVFTPESCQ
jgi:Fibronectin type III domain